MTNERTKKQPLWVKAVGAIVVLVAGALGLLPKDGEAPAGSGAEQEQVARERAGTPQAPPSIRGDRTESPSPRSAAPAKKDDGDGGAAQIKAAFRANRSDMWIEGRGVVQRTLADDLVGSRHQKFILELENGHTVVVAHNIDLAPRVPLERGDTLRFYGEYEWNEKGGVIHWTHHDPGGRREGGWLELDGKRYE